MEQTLRVSALSSFTSSTVSNVMTAQAASSLKSGLPLLCNDSTKALRLTGFSHGKLEKTRRSVGVQASAIDPLVKGLEGLFHRGQESKSDNVEYVSLSGTLVVRKKSLLKYADVGSDFVDDSEDRVLNRKVTLQLISADQVQPGTQTGKLGTETVVENWFKSQDTLKQSDISYPITFKVPNDFGTPGAFTVKNRHSNEVFFKSLTLTLPHGKEVYFGCNSWVYNVNKYKVDRIFFSSQVYMTGQTPPGLVELRKVELQNLRGDGHGERQFWDRIYDYDTYNDLGLSIFPKLRRPPLGGNQILPYPRRCRSGRKLDSADPLSEVKPLSVFSYVPRDEFFEAQKETDFLSNMFRSLGHALIPVMKSVFSGKHMEFTSFKDLRNLYEKGIDLKKPLQKQAADQAAGSNTENAAAQLLHPSEVVKSLGADDHASILKFSVPQVIEANEEAWMEDEEFGRQTLAGVNPFIIQRLTEFPLVSSLNDVEKYGDPRSAITAEHIEPYMEGLTVQQALNEKRLYTLDFHDSFLPYIQRMNESKDFDSKAYATRTILFLASDKKMMPVAIELALPGNTSSSKRVLTPPPKDGNPWLWRLAKAHVWANDNAFNQIYTHWTRTHAAFESYIIATNRQLSVLHPVNALLLPHYKNTMTINSSARISLVSAGGLLEECFSTGTYSMEIGAKIYGALWHFEDDAIPIDLLKRGLAEPDQNSESGVKLVIEDYPYAVDGLDLWCVLKNWVQDYVNIYYLDDNVVQQDAELQAWWSEIRTKGHEEKKDAEGWPVLNSKKNLIQILTTIIWLATGHHAAVNFGQYAYTAYMPNHPCTMRRHLPEENSEEYKELLSDPERFFLRSQATPSQAALSMSLVEIFSKHAVNEQYLGEEATDKWADNHEVLKAFEKYREQLQQVEKRMNDRNALKLGNRWGPAQLPYTLLLPSSPTPGLTGRGVPNSISI